MSYAFIQPSLLEKISNKIQQQQNKPGLYVVATPIGNMFDISLRAIYILKTVKYVFAEDTRQAKKLFNFYEIDTPLIACHEYNEIEETVVSKIIEGGKYALISDAGSPLISDPGYRLVNWCYDHGIDVFIIPGACSLITALSSSGLPTNSFTFYGFITPKENARKNFLNSIKNATETMIFFESPVRILKFLKTALEIFGNRHCCICRELTKIYEEKTRGTLQEMINYFSENQPKGEFVIIISGNSSNNSENFRKSEENMLEELKILMQTESLKESVQKISTKYSVSKKNIYQKALEFKKNFEVF